MVRQSVETWTGTSEVVWTRRCPSILTSDIDQLILVKGCKGKTPWAGLSLVAVPPLFHRVSFFEINESLFSKWAESLDDSRNRTARNTETDSHVVLSRCKFWIGLQKFGHLLYQIHRHKHRIKTLSSYALIRNQNVLTGPMVHKARIRILI